MSLIHAMADTSNGTYTPVDYRVRNMCRGYQKEAFHSVEEYKKYHSDQPVQYLLDRLEDDYHQAVADELKGSISYALTQAYARGWIADTHFSPDKALEAKWFIRSLKHQSPAACWLAACIADAGDHITDNFKPLKQAMLERGYDLSRESADRFLVQAALAGNGAACWVLGNALRYKNDPRVKNYKRLLREAGYTPDRDLAERFIVDAAVIGGHGEAASALARSIKQKDKPRHQRRLGFLREHGIEPTEDYMFELEVAAGLSGQAEMATQLYLVVMEPEREISQKKQKILDRHGLVVTPEIAGNMLIDAGLAGWNGACSMLGKLMAADPEGPVADLVRARGYGDLKQFMAEVKLATAMEGDPHLCWFMVQALYMQNHNERDEVFAVLKKKNITPDLALQNRFLVAAALGGKAEAGSLLTRAFLYPDNPGNTEKLDALREFGLEPSQKTLHHIQVMAAMAGDPALSWRLAKAIDHPDDPEYADLYYTFDSLDLGMDIELFRTALLVNVVKAKRYQEKLTKFYDVGKLMTQKSPFSKSEMDSYRNQVRDILVHGDAEDFVAVRVRPKHLVYHNKAA